jgi:hypothetical protein
MICSECETELNTQNTQEHEGFDASGYTAGKPFGALKSWFIKCDDCFNRAIDNHLENLYS